MQFQFAFRHMDTSPALQTYAEQKLRERIEKFVSKPISAFVTFSVLRHQNTAHLSLDAGDGFGLEMEHTAEDMYATVDQLADKLTRQLQKHKEKLKDHKAPKLGANLVGMPGAGAEAAEAPVDADEILRFEQGKRRASR